MATSVTLKPNAIDISGSTSGTTTLQASAVAGTTTLTLPAATDTLVGKATTDTLTNKTLTGAAMNGTLGATTPSTASVTTLTTSSTVTHSGGTANGVAYLDGSKVLTTGSALVFDGSNLGLGVTPSAWSGAGKILEAGAAGSALIGWGASEVSLGVGSYYNAGWKWAATNSLGASQYNQYNGAHYWSVAAPTSHTAGNAISFTQAMTLDASNNLLLGTTTASANFYVYGAPVSYAGLNTTAILSSSASQSTGTGGLLAFEGKYTSGGALANFAAIGGLKENSTDSNYAGYLGFYTRSNGSLAAERARIDSSGNLQIGTSTLDGRLQVQAPNGIVWARTTAHPNNGTQYFDSFRYGTTEIGKITGNNSNVSYVTSSDYRLKENIAPMTGALATVALLKPCTYTWKVDGSAGQGFIAHELQEVVPEAVVGEKDAVKEDGSIDPQGIDTSFLVATLTAAIQEMKAIIDTQASTITQLQADVAALKGASA